MSKSILLIGNFLSATQGPGSACEDLAGQLSTSGWRVITASAKDRRLPRILDMVATAWLRRDDYDLAHVDVFSDSAFFWAEAVCQTMRFARKPYVLTLRGGLLPVFSRRWPGRVRRLLSSAAAVTTPSNYLLEEMDKFRNDMKVIPNSLDLQVYRFRVRSRPQPQLVWLRAFHHIYNPQITPKVLALLSPDFPAIRLNMVGPDKRDGSLNSMQKVAAELGVADRITVVGQVSKSQVPFYMNQGEIFLNTTNVDNTPVSVLEAMASGLCIVTSNVGGIPHLLDHERNALLVPPDNPDAIAAAVRRILTERGLADYLSMNARKKAERYDWSVTLPQWNALLRKMAGI